jgi:hypothetical protein
MDWESHCIRLWRDDSRRGVVIADQAVPTPLVDMDGSICVVRSCVVRRYRRGFWVGEVGGGFLAFGH